MGTSYNVVAVDPTRSINEADAKAGIESALSLVNRQMSNWDATSEISRFNAKSDLEAMSVSSDLAKVMQAAEQVHVASEGRFDTTMGPLIELWGFGATGSKHLATEAEIADAQSAFWPWRNAECWRRIAAETSRGCAGLFVGNRQRVWRGPSRSRARSSWNH